MKGALRSNPLHAGAAAVMASDGVDGVLTAALTIV